MCPQLWVLVVECPYVVLLLFFRNVQVDAYLAGVMPVEWAGDTDL